MYTATRQKQQIIFQDFYLMVYIKRVEVFEMKIMAKDGQKLLECAGNDETPLNGYMEEELLLSLNNIILGFCLHYIH